MDGQAGPSGGQWTSAVTAELVSRRHAIAAALEDAATGRDGSRDLPDSGWAELADGLRAQAAEREELRVRAATFSPRAPRQLALLTAGVLRARQQRP